MPGTQCEFCGKRIPVLGAAEHVATCGLDDETAAAVRAYAERHPRIHVYGDVIVTPEGEVIELPMSWDRSRIIREVYEAYPDAGITHHSEVASYWDAHTREVEE